MKWTKTTLKKLEELYGELGYKIRYEKGQFQSGHCLVEQQKIVVINKFFDTEGRIQALIDILERIEWVDGNLSDASLKFVKRLLSTLDSSDVVEK
jgi:hypothetical protein